jgi:uncharacterized membrane protein
VTARAAGERDAPVGAIATREATEQPPNRGALLAVLGLTVAMTAMVLFRLGTKSLWQDEAYTWSSVSRSFTDYLSLLRGYESQNVLYSLLMFAWVRVGDSEALLRLPAAVFTVCSVPAMYYAGRALFDRRVGLLAALLFTVNVNALAFGQEARAYSLLILLGALSIGGFATEVRQPSRRSWWAWVVPSALLVFAHPYGIYVVVAELGSLVFLRPARAALRPFVEGAAVVVVAAIPVLVLLATQTGSRSPFGLPPAPEAARYVTGLLGKAGAPLVLAWLVLLVYGAVSMARVLRDASSTMRWQIATVWWLPFATLVLVGITALVLDVLTDRHVLVALPAVVLLGAASLAQIRAPRALAVATLLVVALSLVGVGRWYVDHPKQGWRDATAYVLERTGRGDAVVFADDQGRVPFEYYARDDARRAELVPVFPAASWGKWGTGDQHYVLPGRVTLTRIDRRYRRIWVVAAGPLQPTPRFGDRDLPALQRRFARFLPDHRRTANAAFDDGVRVWRYDASNRA